MIKVGEHITIDFLGVKKTTHLNFMKKLYIQLRKQRKLKF